MIELNSITICKDDFNRRSNQIGNEIVDYHFNNYFGDS